MPFQSQQGMWPQILRIMAMQVCVWGGKAGTRIHSNELNEGTGPFSKKGRERKRKQGGIWSMPLVLSWSQPPLAHLTGDWFSFIGRAGPGSLRHVEVKSKTCFNGITH